MSNIFKIRLRKGDTVVVRAGKYKGQTGKITSVHPQDNKVTVEGINIIKKHQKPNQKHPQGAILEITKPIDVSKVGILDPNAPKGSVKASRIGYTKSKDGAKVRVYKTTGKEIK